MIFTAELEADQGGHDDMVMAMVMAVVAMENIVEDREWEKEAGEPVETQWKTPALVCGGRAEKKGQPVREQTVTAGGQRGVRASIYGVTSWL